MKYFEENIYGPRVKYLFEQANYSFTYSIDDNNIYRFYLEPFREEQFFHGLGLEVYPIGICGIFGDLMIVKKEICDCDPDFMKNLKNNLGRYMDVQLVKRESRNRDGFVIYVKTDLMLPNEDWKKEWLDIILGGLQYVGDIRDELRCDAGSGL